VSDLAFVLMVFASIVVFGVVTYFKTIPSSRIARFLQKPERMAVFFLPLVSILFGVHLPNDIFYFLVLTIFLLPLVFYPTEESARHLTAQSSHV
jgi:hypothetical protein